MKHGYHTRHRRHSTSRLVLVGTLHVQGTRAWVVTEEGRYTLARNGQREAIDQDTVAVTVAHTRSHETLAYVQHVIERAHTSFVARYEVAGPLGVLVSLDPHLHHDFFITPNDASPKRLGVREGDIVSAHILEYPTRHTSGVGTIEERIGAEDELDMGIETIIATHSLPHRFPKAVEQEAETMKLDREAALAEPGREDLRQIPLVTIDPVDAKDFDDAVYAKETDSGYELVVAIADVSHYVSWKSACDIEARKRTTSVYLADRVIPMLPERLCNDICSLKPEADRLAMVVKVKLTQQGVVETVEPTSAVIQSHARLTYDEVTAYLAGDKAFDKLPVKQGDQQEIAESLRALSKLSEKRRALRAQKGSLDFVTREAKVILNSDGKPTGVRVRSKSVATSLVEEAMLIANEGVAQLLSEHEIPAAYRVHPQPAQKDLRALVPVLNELGLLPTRKTVERFCSGDPKAQAQVLHKVEGTADEYLVSTLLIRAQSRAHYLVHNEGHYALGFSAYCHFTSPIRRYADITVHRALKAYLKQTLASKEQQEIKRLLPRICDVCSKNERVADTAERDSEAVKLSELMSEHIGEVFSGVIDGCERFGIFVTLDETCAEGMVPINKAGMEQFMYDEARMRVVGASTGRIYRVGQRVWVKVVASDTLKGRLTFAFAKGEE